MGKFMAKKINAIWGILRGNLGVCMKEYIQSISQNRKTYYFRRPLEIIISPLEDGLRHVVMYEVYAPEINLHQYGYSRKDAIEEFEDHLFQAIIMVVEESDKIAKQKIVTWVKEVVII